MRNARLWNRNFGLVTWALLALVGLVLSACAQPPAAPAVQQVSPAAQTEAVTQAPQPTSAPTQAPMATTGGLPVTGGTAMPGGSPTQAAGTATGQPAGTPTTAPASGASQQVKIVDAAFEPQTLTIKAGTTVVWTHTGLETHTVTADNGAFDSGALSQGDTFQFTFNQAGTFPYHCEFHGGPGGQGMSGTIVVTP